LPEIEVTCDRVLIINQGRVVAQGTPADLRREIFGHATYHLELAGDAAALPATLARVEPSLRTTASGEPGPDGFRRVTVTTARPDELGEPLLAALAADRFRVRSLAREQPTLEDVFLAATRRSWDAVAPAPEARPVTSNK